MTENESTITEQIHQQVGEAVVVNHSQKTYRPAEGEDQINYPDAVLGFDLDMNQDF